MTTISVAGIITALTPGVAGAADGPDWDAIAQCESGGNWSINTGNNYYGGLQFALPTWRSHGGKGMPHHASREQQIAVAQRVLKTQGISAWPTCGKRAGKAVTAPRRAQQKSAATRAVKTTSHTHTVMAGDMLCTIATKHSVPGGWRALWAANRNSVSDPNAISVGQALQLPR